MAKKDAEKKTRKTKKKDEEAVDKKKTAAKKKTETKKPAKKATKKAEPKQETLSQEKVESLLEEIKPLLTELGVDEDTLDEMEVNEKAPVLRFAASAKRARKCTTNLEKAFKEFRKASIEHYK